MWFVAFFKKRREDKKREAIARAEANLLAAREEGYVWAMIFFAREIKKLEQS